MNLIVRALVVIVCACGGLVSGSVFAATPSPEGARVFIIEPKNGATVPATFKVEFGIEGMTLAPAGTFEPNTGHHHLLIDVDSVPDMAVPLPATENILHFGKAQSQTFITLEPGKHTLQLVLGDGNHIPHEKPVVSQVITVNVE
ncbi:DUF4399 domain-containing protein [Vibrio sp. SM6]|uniref:DUF4399 domain-containing protein n=1 Tax=Vibrio agarilyticus TaxID=2726741 RepID=A0A7X8TR22_9VIBR|nr:DUF4399 domain-containing protein [Vibrio agarilyticus]NLS13066.1 DUF4399 domain-containing protein [Vibrio agarilyticus]